MEAAVQAAQTAEARVQAAEMRANVAEANGQDLQKQLEAVVAEAREQYEHLKRLNDEFEAVTSTRLWRRRNRIVGLLRRGR